jgi:hypothetical protein
MLGSAISLHRLRKKLREQTTNADRMSREWQGKSASGWITPIAAKRPRMRRQQR